MDNKFRYTSIFTKFSDGYQHSYFFRLDYPRPRKITGFNGQHQVKSGRVVIVDAQTFLIPSFNYDGQAPDAHFWVGTGERPGPEGILSSNYFFFSKHRYYFYYKMYEMEIKETIKSI